MIKLEGKHTTIIAPNPTVAILMIHLDLIDEVGKLEPNWDKIDELTIMLNIILNR